MKLSVCINSVTGELSRTDAMRLSKKLGYTAVEFWEGGDNPDFKEWKPTLDETGLTVACMGMVGGLVDSANRSAVLEATEKSIESAKFLGAKCIIATTGQELEGVSRDVQRQNIVDNLKAVAPLFKGTGLTLVLEPLNTLVNHQGYYLARSEEAFDILREVNCPNIKLLYDIYHQQITEGHLITTIQDNIDLIGHFHLAGNPGRGEPYFGEINYKEVFTAIDAAGYDGYAGLEYWAKVDSVEDSLKKCLEI